MPSSQILILTVSQLNRQVKSYLENEIGVIHVEGEISNLSKPSSGHVYFTLKDGLAQLRCVLFKNRQFNASSNPLQDGQKVVASGRLSLYEARGDYQLIVEQLSDAGLGALYQLFEELKIKLAAEGLFDPSRKKPLPPIPKAIGIISSTHGAALQDILSTLARRFPQAKLFIYPSEVQGIGAPAQLIKALQHAQEDNQSEVLIIARGGGSIEDLWAFNDEQLVREIALCTLPIISGVGHETDFTLVDFVADYRAETPTAAAIAATPDCVELLNAVDKIRLRLQTGMSRILHNLQVQLNHVMEKISSPQKSVRSHWQALDYLERQLLAALRQTIHKEHLQLRLCVAHLQAYNPKTKLTTQQNHLKQLKELLSQHMLIKLNHLRYQFNSKASTLHAISPLATLDRGYAIASKNHKVVYSGEELHLGDLLEIRLSKGSLDCRVLAIHSPMASE